MIKVDNVDTCPVCGEQNTVIAKDGEDYTLLEAETKCNKCGHVDYWAYGYYESCQWSQL